MVDTTVWDTVGTTDTDTTTARGLLMPNLKPKPHPRLILPLMLGTDTMAVDTDMADTDMADTGMAADTADTTVMANRFLNSNILPFFFNNPPLELSKPKLLPSAILLKLCFFMRKNCYKTHIWTQL